MNCYELRIGIWYRSIYNTRTDLWLFIGSHWCCTRAWTRVYRRWFVFSA